MIYIASDHAGFQLKQKIVEHLKAKDVKFDDLGAHALDPQDDYPDFAQALTQKMHPAVAGDIGNLGILVCGTGQGVCISANRNSDIRAVQAWSVETAKQAREHLDANVLCLAGRAQNLDNELEIVDTFLQSEFSSDERHLRRIQKI